MSRASKRTGFGQQRGAVSPRMTYSTTAPNLPKNGDRWVDSDTTQDYIYNKESGEWLPLYGDGGNIGGLVYVNTDAVTTVSSLQTVAYVTATVDRTATIIATSCINGNASTTMTVTSHVMLNATTVNTLVSTINAGDDIIINIDVPIEDVPAGTNDIWVQQSANTGNWVLYTGEQNLYALTFYNIVTPTPPYVYGSYELLADTTISSATTQVDFTGLSLDKNDEILLVSDIVNASGSTSNYSLYVNADTTATNYYSQYLYANSTTLSSARSNTAIYGSCETSDNLLSINNISLTKSGYFSFQSHTTRRYGASDLGLQNLFSIKTATISSITKLSVVASITNAIGVGSRFWLYKKGSV